ncbi:MAG: hypothetical protein RLZZ69_1519 [Cyanobacteriota bacterium]|jgi:hypothetical protein
MVLVNERKTVILFGADISPERCGKFEAGLGFIGTGSSPIQALYDRNGKFVMNALLPVDDDYAISRVVKRIYFQLLTDD